MFMGVFWHLLTLNFLVNFILDNMTDKSPQLKPYPSWSAHQMSDDEPPAIVSPFRVRADACGRLWVLDTGVAELLGNTTVLSRTKLLIYDLHTDDLLRSYEFPADQVKENSFFASIAVEDDDCEDAFAYSADLGKPGLVVYSWKSKTSWRIQHNFFHPDPTAGNFSIGGNNFEWDDGLFGLALSKPQGAENQTILYFHPFVSKDEFMVPTKFLKDQSATENNANYHEFKQLGTRGENAQSNAEFLDKNTGVLFYTLPNLNAVACWKTTLKEYNVKSQGRIFMDKVLMEFPNDVKVDDKGRLWVISDRLQKYMYDSLDSNEVNFRIFMQTVKEAIANTACDVKTKPLPDIITHLNDYIKPTTVATTKGSAGKLEATVMLFVLAIASRFL